MRRCLGLRNGIPGHDTMRRVFATISPHELETRFEQWMEVLYPALAGRVIAIDGKALRATRGATGSTNYQIIIFSQLDAHN